MSQDWVVHSLIYQWQRCSIQQTEQQSNTISTGAITSWNYMPQEQLLLLRILLGNMLLESFSFSTAYTQADAIPTAAVTVGDVANFGNITSTTAGVCW